MNFLDAHAPQTRLLGLVALLALIVGCTEDPTGTTATTGSRVAGEVTADAAQFATPTPRVIITPVPGETPKTATPEPSPTLVAPSAPTPSPTPVGASPSVSPSASAGPYTKTGKATDIAVSGPGYFVLSTKPTPATVEDLLFTKNGHLTVEKDTSGTLTVYRIRHGAHQFHLVGFARSGGPGIGAPAETSTDDAAVLTALWGDPVAGAGLSVDADRNPDAAAKLGFDYTGKLRIAEADPRGADGTSVQAYVAIAQFDTPDELIPQPGFAGVYKYQAEAGTLRLGVAVTGTGRPVGNANLILTSTLEQGD